MAAQQKAPAAAAALPKVTVYKTSSCGCCRLWVDHMKQSGFDVQAMDVSSADVRAVSKAAGLKERASCHTSKIGNYVVEGHVPADDIKRMLKEKPAIAGLCRAWHAAGIAWHGARHEGTLRRRRVHERRQDDRLREAQVTRATRRRPHPRPPLPAATGLFATRIAGMPIATAIAAFISELATMPDRDCAARDSRSSCRSTRCASSTASAHRHR